MSRHDYHQENYLLTLDAPRAPYDRPALHIPGFAAYCPVCGTGYDKAKEADKCCAKAYKEASNRTVWSGGRSGNRKIDKPGAKH